VCKNSSSRESLCTPRKQATQTMIKDILGKLDKTAVTHHLELIWILGHLGLDGNERADVDANRAALDPRLSWPSKYTSLRSTRIQGTKNMAKRQWQAGWTERTKLTTLLRQLRSSRIGPKFFNRLQHRRATATMAQLQMGHCALNTNLYRFGKRSSP